MRPLLLLCLLILTCTLNAQKENNVWYFGGKVGLDFNNGSPIVLSNSKMDTREGCSSVSDKNGNLLFYTDGITIWNSLHNIMSNGTGLKGNSSSTQSSVVVKKPGSDYLYYIFNPDCSESATGGLHYSIVDMGKNGGLGEVIEKNTLLLSGRISEKIVTIKSDGGCGFWIITHPLSNTTFYSYLLNSTGINTTPVTSLTNLTLSPNDILGYLKATPDGTKIASCSFSASRITLYDFDNATGKVLNGFVVDSTYNPYGCSFSPNSKLLYTCNYSRPEIYQFDVSLSSINDIKSSKTTIYKKNSGASFGAMQIGPDKKIYITKEGNKYLGIINNPDIWGNGCNYNDSGLLITSAGSTPKLGLPNFIDNPNPFSVGLSLGPDKKSCINDTFTIGALFNLKGSFLWSTGDTTQTITRTQPGTYWLKAETNCGSVATVLYDTIEITTVVDTVPLDIGNDTSICDKQLLLYTNKVNDIKYQWSTGSDSSSTIANISKKYWLKTTSVCGIKADTISIIFTADSIPKVFIGNDTTICQAAFELKTDAVPNAKYLWSTGDTSNKISPTTSGLYWVKVSNACQIKSDSILLRFINSNPLALGNDTLICGATSFTIKPQQNQNIKYLWSTGDTTPSITVTSSGTYILSQTSNCDTKTDSIRIDFYTDIIAIDIGNDTVLCSGQIILTAGNIPNAKYKWSSGDTSQSISASQAGLYKLGVTTVCNSYFEDSINISFYRVQPLKLNDDIVACSESFTGATLSPSHTYKSYLWSTGSQMPKISITQPDTYILSVTDSCEAVFTDTVIVSICNCSLLIPNAFTPNNDGLNDIFEINAECLPAKYTIKIYNRWGALVYEENNPQHGWDGSYKGKQVPEGVYFTIIDYYYTSNIHKSFYSGTITLLR